MGILLALLVDSLIADDKTQCSVMTFVGFLELLLLYVSPVAIFLLAVQVLIMAGMATLKRRIILIAFVLFAISAGLFAFVLNSDRQTILQFPAAVLTVDVVLVVTVGGLSLFVRLLTQKLTLPFVLIMALHPILLLSLFYGEIRAMLNA
jgi:hypothetical protein